MDDVLVICYSYTGISRRAAQLLCASRGWPLAEIKELESRSTLRCVLDSLLRRRPAVRYEGPDPAGFRTVVLMSPIWMLRLAAPMRSFLADYREQLPRVAAIVFMNTGGATNAFREMADLLGHGLVAGGAFTARSIEDGSSTDALLDFGEALQPQRPGREKRPEPAWLT